MEVWNVTARPTTVSGDKCVAEAVQSLIGTPKTYSITVTTPVGGSVASLKVTSTSGDYDCTFPAAADSSGFTTSSGFYKCRADFGTKGFRCYNGTEANLFTLGQNISGSISGDEISGKWTISWFDKVRQPIALETTIEFTGHRK